MERLMSRASEYMKGLLRDQRSSTRTPLHLSGSVKLSRNGGDTQVAFSRDVSTSGLFFFSNLTVELDDDLTLTFVTPNGGCLLFQGRVVRVEQHSAGAARGIALLLSSRVLAA